MRVSAPVSAPPPRLPWFLLDLSKGTSGLHKHPERSGIMLSVAVLCLETSSLNKLVFANVPNCFAF